MDDDSAGGDSAHCCKVARLAADANLSALDEELVTRRRDDESLRDLAAFVNDRIVEAALEDADIDVGATPTQVRLALADDGSGAADLTVSERERIAAKLDRSPVDVDALETQFVSHETVRTHLTDHLDVDTSREPNSATVEETREMIASIRERDASIVEQALHALRRDDRLESGPLDAALTVRVTCTACGQAYAVDELLDEGGCACGGSAE